MKRVGFWTGALAGALLSAPLAALFFAGWRLAGLPLAPLHLFDGMARVLPGPILTFGIDTMVKAIRMLGIADTSTAAKTAEQSMAILLFLAVGAFAAGLLYVFLRNKPARSVAVGVALGALFGIAAILLRRRLSSAVGSIPAAAADLWTIGLFTAWGATLGWLRRRLEPVGAAAGAADRAAPASVARLDRRTLLVRLGGATATLTIVGAAIGALAGRSRRTAAAPEGRRWSADNPLPNAGARVAPAPGTRPELTPLESHYRIDISTTPPVLDGEAWRLKIGGLVDRPLELSLPEIRSQESLHQFVTLACISNPVAGGLIGTTRWSGVSLQKLLPQLSPKPGATHLKLTAADRFFEFVEIERIRQDPRVMLAYDWDGLPLAIKHGFPLRIYIPDHYGMKQPKWLTSIEAVDRWEPGYWVRRGWDKDARMKASAVVDTVSVDMMLSEANEQTRIPIGGIAHAGARGISRVEVRVDDGPWENASLRDPISELTWVLWRYDWPFSPGSHTFAVRCVDGAGAAQIETQAPPHPSGASGIHTRNVML